MTLVSAVLATGAMATMLSADAIDLDGVDIKAGHTLVIDTDIMYNAGVIHKVADDSASMGSTAKVAASEGTTATIYNVYNAAEDEGRLDDTAALADRGGKTFKETVLDLVGECTNRSAESGDQACGESTYVPKKVYTIQNRGSVVTSEGATDAVVLDNVSVQEAGLLESISVLTKNASEFDGDHRVFNLVFPANGDGTPVTLDYTGPLVSEEHYCNLSDDVVVSIPTSSSVQAVNIDFNHSFSLTQFRGLDTTNYISTRTDATSSTIGANFSSADVTMQGKFEARLGSSVVFDGDGASASTNTKITFAKDVDMSKASSAKFKNATFVFKGKLIV